LDSDETTTKHSVSDNGKTIGELNSSTSQLQNEQCKLSALSGWVLRGLLYFHKARSASTHTLDKVSGFLQEKSKFLLSVILYISLSLLTVQGVLIMVLLAQSLLPLGMWFLMTCISSMGGIFCFTTATTDLDPPTRKAKLS